MFRVKQASPFPDLAQAWSRTEKPGADLFESVRAAFAAVAPQDFSAAAPLAEALLGRIGERGQRALVRRTLFALLDGVRRRLFANLLEPELVDPWVKLVLRIVREADYTFGDLLRSREETDPKTVALRVLGKDASEITVADLSRRTRAIARGILALTEGEPDSRVAILSENCVEAALCDLACLSNGIVDLPLPANAVADQIVTMLRHSGARVLLAQDEEQLAKVLPSLSGLPELRDVVAFSRTAADRNGLLSLEQMVSQGGDFDDGARAERAAAVRASDVATVMYTSGTTGKPKGIVFTQENIVSKRFCRAFALPEVSEGDVFLCYLPLYHTFGRYLDMCGSLFWGGTYVFARSTAPGTLIEDFRRVKPTVFISVPKKWMELHDAAAWESGADAGDVSARLRSVTGGRLRHGLSAAGYLDPAVFKAFHAAGIELCSGYGMTEATGGVTMTPPGEYVPDSVGKPLPGIEARRAEDGELQIRGPYVSPGYWTPGREIEPREGGWFGTGDLFAVARAGHFRITGRKKEIYKNRQGQTIAPQRIENLFKEFEAVSQAFLVGDHREFNTLLVWPNPASAAVAGRGPAEMRELLSSLVASANRFLAPFERVVAFHVLPRALDEEHGELTHKATFRREVVAKNWAEDIDRMYQRKHLALSVDGSFLRIPNWVLREIGVLQHEVSLDGNKLTASNRSLAVGAVPEAPGSMRVGDLAYSTAGAVVDLGELLSRPALWLGNESFRSFLGDEAFVSLVSRRRKSAGDLRIDPRFWRAPPPDRIGRLLEIVEARETTYGSIHAAAELLRAERPEANRAVAHMQAGLEAAQPEHAILCRALLRRAADAPDEEIRRRAFRLLVPGEEPGETVETLRLFLDRMGPMALRDEDLSELGERGLSDAQVDVLLSYVSSNDAISLRRGASDRRLLVGAMRLLTATAAARPAFFARARMPLARLTHHDEQEIAARAGEELDRLRRAFQHWIGPNLRLALDPGTGREYAWKDAVVFDESVAPAPAHHLLQAIADSTIVRGSIFLLGYGALISLADIPPGGASVGLLGRQHGKSVYRLTIRTRARETFEIAINVAEDLSFADMREEVSWLLASGAEPPLVEKFGGTFAEWGIFTEEFIPGDTVEKQIGRLVRQGQAARLAPLWPFLVWTALEGHVGFWDRTGRRLALREPSPAAFIVPSHDYQTGGRLVSISDRTPCTAFDDLLDRFQTSFVWPIEGLHPDLRGAVDDVIVFSAVLQALGEERGRAALSQAAIDSRRAVAIESFLARIKDEGFTPKDVFFAVQRYRRWLEVNPTATLEARARMLGELWGTYRLAQLEQTWPDTRLRFFRRTVFARARPELASALDRLVARARTMSQGALDLEEQVAAMRGAIATTAEEDYFLARVTYRFLAPNDDTALISMPSAGHTTTEVVVALTDLDGGRFSIRAPVSPREVSRLLGMFHDANLPVTFSAEHEFLVCLDAKETPIGGVFFRWLSPEHVHMEKLVIGRTHRGKGVSDALMRELFRRVRARGATRLETGWFQTEFFARHGFHTDPTSGGLARDLGPEDAEG